MARGKSKQVFVSNYVFANRAEIFSDLISLMEDYNLNRLAEDSGVTLQTLRNWMWGETYNPHINTMLKVADAMGYDIALRKRAKTKLGVVK